MRTRNFLLTAVATLGLFSSAALAADLTETTHPPGIAIAEVAPQHSIVLTASATPDPIIVDTVVAEIITIIVAPPTEVAVNDETGAKTLMHFASTALAPTGGAADIVFGGVKVTDLPGDFINSEKPMTVGVSPQAIVFGGQRIV